MDILKKQPIYQTLSKATSHAYLLIGEDLTVTKYFAQLFATSLLCEQKISNKPKNSNESKNLHNPTESKNLNNLSPHNATSPNSPQTPSLNDYTPNSPNQSNPTPAQPSPLADACGTCSICNRVKKNIHPDCIVLDKDKILVADIENICQRMVYSKAESQYKIIIIADFSSTNEQAQNKLLKSLEEPTPNTFFVLCASNRRTVLNTIQSRCIVLENQPISPQDLHQLLQDRYSDHPNLPLALSLSNGSLTTAQDILNNPQTLQNLDTAFQVLLLLKVSSDILPVSRILLDSKDNLSKIVDFLQIIFLDILAQGNGLSQYILSKNHFYDIMELSKFYNESAILRILSKIKETKERILTHCNATMTVDSLLFMLLECRHNARPLTLNQP